MLCLLLGTGLLLATLWMLAIALALFLAGTEIRVRIEDELLASRFGASFAQYKRAVPAYLPFVR
jgi:protein-S-isoprenylcysteine O-methyltransferase Ste14